MRLQIYTCGGPGCSSENRDNARGWFEFGRDLEGNKTFLPDRIVACVNAMAELNPEKLGELLRAVREWEQHGRPGASYDPHNLCDAISAAANAAIGALPAGDAP